MLAFLILMLATIGVFVEIFFVSHYAFWIAVVAYVILYWGSRIGASWPGILSLLLLALAVVGVFINIPIVSNYAFWFLIAAFMIRLLARIPDRVPKRVGVVGGDPT